MGCRPNRRRRCLYHNATTKRCISRSALTFGTALERIAPESATLSRARREEFNISRRPWMDIQDSPPIRRGLCSIETATTNDAPSTNDQMRSKRCVLHVHRLPNLYDDVRQSGGGGSTFRPQSKAPEQDVASRVRMTAFGLPDLCCHVLSIAGLRHWSALGAAVPAAKRIRWPQARRSRAGSGSPS
jgi:hypothetical protein